MHINHQNLLTMKQVLTFILCISFQLSAIAQDSASPFLGTSIKFSPSSLVAFSAPAIQFGIERPLRYGFTHQHELGYLFDGFNHYDGQFWGHSF